MKKSYKEALKYIAVGIIGLGVEWTSFFIFRDILHLNYIVSHVLGSLLAISNNFILNSRYTFHATDRMWKRATSFFGIAGIGLVISTSLLPIFVHWINNITPLLNFEINQKTIQTISKLGATGFVTILQFFMNKYFTFKTKKNDIQK